MCTQVSKVRKWYPKSPPSDGEAFSKNRGIVLREKGNYRRTTKGKRKRKVSGGGGHWNGAEDPGQVKDEDFPVSHSLEGLSSLEMPHGCLSEGTMRVHVQRQDFLWKNQTITSFPLSYLLHVKELSPVHTID